MHGCHDRIAELLGDGVTLSLEYLLGNAVASGRCVGGGASWFGLGDLGAGLGVFYGLRVVRRQAGSYGGSAGAFVMLACGSGFAREVGAAVDGTGFAGVRG